MDFVLNRSAFITAIKMTLAAVVAFILYNVFALPAGYWSVVTVAAATVAGLSATFTKSLMRLIGTILGAISGYVIATMAHGNLEFILPLFCILILASSYVTVQSTGFSYAGIVFGLTMIIVIASSYQMGGLKEAAIYRSLEVLLGIVVLATINLMMWFITRSDFENPKSFMLQLAKLYYDANYFIWSKRSFKAAIKITLASSATFILWAYFRIPHTFWATVACLIIMEETTINTQYRAWILFLANTVAAVIGAVSALVIDGHVWWFLLPLTIWFFISGYVIGMRKPYSLIGNTSAVALTIMLLVEPGAISTFHIVLTRFISVMAGISVGVITTHYLWPVRKSAINA